MRMIGFALVTVGFLYAAYLTSLDATEVDTWPFVFALVVAAGGVALARFAAHQAATHVDRLATDLATIRTSLDQLAAKTEALDGAKDAVDVYDLRHRIDDEMMGDLDAFAQARESIAHQYSLQSYADIMSHFAAGERYLNRVWSASTDGYIDEAHTYLGQAREQFAEARGRFAQLTASA